MDPIIRRLYLCVLKDGLPVRVESVKNGIMKVFINKKEIKFLFGKNKKEYSTFDPLGGNLYRQFKNINMVEIVKDTNETIEENMIGLLKPNDW